jgi:hypothetical protein
MPHNIVQQMRQILSSITQPSVSNYLTTDTAGLTRLSLMVMTGNKGAVRLYERMGFESRAFKMLKRL